MNRRSGLRPQSHTLILSFSLLSSFVLMNGCAAAVSKAAEEKAPATSVVMPSDRAAGSTSKGATIPITAEGPADTVRVFYKHLREKRFREAIFLTNLRPAIEGLTDTELKEFALDFEDIAGQVPVNVEINGEIITGDLATVTANLPNEDGDKHEIQTLKLRRDNGVWVILTVDGDAAKRIKADGKNYLLNLRIETHENEARKMLERVSKAQLAHSLQHGGVFADLPTLIGGGLLPDDIKTSDSTGYLYAVSLAADKKQYFATATPAAFGKSGRLSFILQLDGKGISRVTSKDTGGKVMRK
jgi:hypothetical protein